MNDFNMEPWAERLINGLERGEDFRTLFRNRLTSNKELVQVFLKRNPFRRRHDKGLVTHWSQLLNTTADSTDIEEIAFYMSINDLEWKFGRLSPAEQHDLADKAWSLVMPENTRLSHGGNPEMREWSSSESSRVRSGPTNSCPTSIRDRGELKECRKPRDSRLR